MIFLNGVVYIPTYMLRSHCTPHLVITHYLTPYGFVDRACKHIMMEKPPVSTTNDVSIRTAPGVTTKVTAITNEQRKTIRTVSNVESNYFSLRTYTGTLSKTIIEASDLVGDVLAMIYKANVDHGLPITGLYTMTEKELFSNIEGLLPLPDGYLENIL